MNKSKVFVVSISSDFPENCSKFTRKVNFLEKSPMSYIGICRRTASWALLQVSDDSVQLAARASLAVQHQATRNNKEQMKTKTFKWRISRAPRTSAVQHFISEVMSKWDHTQV